jgi:hypothetical protein
MTLLFPLKSIKYVQLLYLLYIYLFINIYDEHATAVKSKSLFVFVFFRIQFHLAYFIHLIIKQISNLILSQTFD